MSINAYIARGFQAPGRDLPNIWARQRDEQRADAQAAQENAFRSQAMDLQTRRVALDEQQHTQVSEAQKQRTEYLRLANALRAGANKAQIAQHFPDLVSQVPGFDQFDDAQTREVLSTALWQTAAAAGIELPPAPKQYAVTQQRGPGGSTIVSDGSRFQVVQPERAGAGTGAGGRAPAGAKPPTPQQQKLDQTTRVNLVKIDGIERRLTRLDNALAALERLPLVDTGPLDQFAVSRLPAGQELSTAAESIRPLLTALTRVPGVGSQSDLEARLDALQYPSIDKAPEVNRATMQELRQFIADLRNAYVNPADESGYLDRTTPTPAGGPQPGTVEDGYRFKGGDPADQSSWERVR